MNIEGMFSIADIMNYDYCPRIPYLEYVLNDPQRKTSKTKRGLRTHEEFSIKAKRAKIVAEFPNLEKKFRVRLSSKKYNLQTLADCILFNGNEAYPVEFKYSNCPGDFLYSTQKHQVAAQALLIEEAMGKVVPYGYLKFLLDGKLVKVEITEDLKNEVKFILNTPKNFKRGAYSRANGI